MQQESTASAHGQGNANQPARERVGLALFGRAGVPHLLERLRQAEQAGVRQFWMTQLPTSPDTLTLFAAALVQTERIRLGTAIVPTYPRHPLVMAQQAYTLEELGPGRLRLGVGTSHRHSIEGVYGFSMVEPLEQLREYVSILRAALWDGAVDVQGRFYTAHAAFPQPVRVPILISALRSRAFRLAGELADGAISWMCPHPYLLEKARPALVEGATSRGRPVPPLLAHVPVALGTDWQAVLEAARSHLGFYGRAPFYRNMFADAGYPLGADGLLPEELIRNLVVWGDEASVADRLRELLAQGLDELIVTLVPLADDRRELVQLMELLGNL
ncbi:MAG: LLM class flavin-dependent oxidoreductase [Thermogemmatispora sp.]|uniref:LLM class flavin-dependent oxidoreductase n=1 Tax=Thermogemmatispora sp. TaxID=1968838 RepID=UPI0019F76E0C|nr:LLM class flavin-dependent oxidoreductase [Thermogemmatispora sp.]MBE3566958.1 LLM class flavin-dependent oxidoreductase [Thermogemmatispora sp.]